MSPVPLPGRRSVLRGSLAASAALSLPAAVGSAVPAFALSGRPKAGWGVQTGDVTADSGLVWVRSDRPARMVVETSATESFRNPRRWHGPLLGTDTDSPVRRGCAGCRRASRSTTACCSPTRTTRAAPESR